MHAKLFSLAILACLLTAVHAAPAPLSAQKRSFVHRVKRTAASGCKDPMAAMCKAYRKFGWNMTAMAMPSIAAVDLAAAAANDTGDSGEVSATPENNAAEFLSPVKIGSGNVQTLTMDFDTGSSDLWVFSTELSTKSIGGHTAFDPTKSQSFELLQGSSFLIQYGDGSGAAGVVGTDTVDIGGATVTGQAVQLATAVSQSFVRDTNNDGLVGLAFSKINTVKPQKQKTFFDSIAPDLDQPVFTADLQEDNTGTYEFGTIDTTKFKGELAFTEIDSSQGFWQFDSPTFSVDGKVIANQNGSPAIADTGTSLLLVDPAVAQTYYASVPGAQLSAAAGGFIYPCSAQLPDFGVAIGSNYTAVVPGDKVTFAEVGQGTCFGGVQSNGGAGLQIYGDVMFKTQFVVFDGGEGRLGMAPKA